MTRGRRLIPLLLLLAIAAILITPLDALAHTRPDPVPVPVPTPVVADTGAPTAQLVAGSATTADSPWLLFVVVSLAIMGTLATRMRRHVPRLLAVVFMVLLGVFVFETGLHSVHHLGRSADEQRCAVASASTHLAGVTGETVDIRATLSIADDEVAPPSVLGPRSEPRRPGSPRAPPIVSPS